MASVVDRLLSKDGLLIAEGYLFEFEARGYLQIGAYVPEVVLEHPELVRQMHHEFAHAGSDVILAFTFYAHREKMRLIGREGELEQINKTALKIAREVADDTGTLMAGDISTTTLYQMDNDSIKSDIFEMFKEQVVWAVEGGADFIVAETFDYFGEAELAVRAINQFGNEPVHFSMAGRNSTLHRLQEGGATIVGLNCSRGPATMLPVLKEIRKTYKGPLAALPVCYRTDQNHVTFEALNIIGNPDRTAFPVELNSWLVSRAEVAEFSREAWELGVRYLGLCCGNRAHYIRAMAEALGRKPAASRYSPDMAQHYSRLTDEDHQETSGKFAELYQLTK